MHAMFAAPTANARGPMSRRPENAAPGAIILSENGSAHARAPDIFSRLSQAERAAVLERGKRQVFYRGSTLFAQGAPHNGIFVIETGRVRVFYTAPAGREITLAYWSPGHFVGGPDVFGEGVHQWSGVAAQNCSVLAFSGRNLRELVVEFPKLAIGIIEGLAFKGRCYSALAQMLGTRSVTERLAHFLTHLTDVYGVPSEEGVAIAATFTHADLAHMVGATRQWVTISLRKLQDQGVLSCKRAHIVVIRPDILARMHGGVHGLGQ